MILVIVAGALIAVAAVRVITGARRHHLLGPGRRRAPAWRCPIGLAGLGGLWSERAGVVNIGLEGMMILGTFCGAWAGCQYGPWLGLVGRDRRRLLGGLLHAVATVTFGVDHIVSGVAINLLAPGATEYLAKLSFNSGRAPTLGGNPKQSPAGRQRALDHRARPVPVAGHARGPPLVPGLRPRRRARRPGHQPVAAHRAGRRCCSPAPSTCCGARRSACGCAPAARRRSPPSRSA